MSFSSAKGSFCWATKMWDGVKGHCSVAKLCLTFATPWTVACQASLFFTIFWSLLKLMSIESVMSTNRLILCCPLLLPSIFPSIRVFSNELALHIGWPHCWSFCTSLSKNVQGWFPLGLMVWSLCCPRDSQRVFSAPFKGWGTCWSWEMQTWASWHTAECWGLTLGTPPFDFPLCLRYKLESFSLGH